MVTGSASYGFPPRPGLPDESTESALATLAFCDGEIVQTDFRISDGVAEARCCLLRFMGLPQGCPVTPPKEKLASVFQL